MSDYNRFLEGEIAKKNKQAVLFDNFMPVFESIIGIHRIHRFKLTLPENVVKTYRRMIIDKGFLVKLSADRLAFLIFANSSPLLLSMSIKVSSAFAHIFSKSLKMHTE